MPIGSVENYRQPRKYQKGDGVKESQWSDPFENRIGTQEATYLSLDTRLVIKTFEKDSRPRPRPWSPGLETKSKTLGNRSRDQDQDLGQQVSRPRPRPWSPGLETKTKTLVNRSRDQDPIFHQALNGHSCKLRT